jgi:H+/gluconate symporter-like permease
MSEAEEIYNACMSTAIAKREAIQARNTWILVGCILASTIATGALILFWYRRNKRKKQKKDTGKNNNIDEKRKSRIEEEEEAMTADNTLLEGNKS